MVLKEKENNFTEIYIRYFKKHHNAVYFALAILFVVQIIILFALTFQMTRISMIIDNNLLLGKDLDNLTSSVDQRLLEVNEKLSENIKIQGEVIKDLEVLKLSKDFTSIAEKSLTSVVSINAFNSEYTEGSLGTGFFVTSTGYVVTNNHVIKNMKYVNVVTNSKNTERAKVIGVDDFKDIALLKIEQNSTRLEFADSSKLQIGQKVIAIGNPLGLEFSLTEGVISGLKRQGDNNLQSYIQTDVAINPGNSGGPLINMEGKVVGLNTFKYVDQTVEGMGFALESNEVKSTVNSIAGFKLIQ